MKIVTCSCGARYKADDRLAGKRVKCKHCGESISVPPEDDIVLEDLHSLVRGERAAEATHGAAPGGPSAAPFPIPTPIIEVETGTGERGLFESLAAFLRDCLWSAVFIIEPSALVAFLIVAALSAVRTPLGFLGCFALPAILVVDALLATFLFRIVEHAAAGESGLPEIAFEEGGWVDTLLIPPLKFVAVCFVAGFPALVYMAVTAPRAIAASGVGSALPPGTIPMLLGVTGFLWPMAMLVIAIGGLGALIRVDLVVRTLVVTILPYVITAGVTTAAFAAANVASNALEVSQAGILGNALASAMVLDVVSMYALVVAMRVIGLYYHHFKRWFAWSWG